MGCKVFKKRNPAQSKASANQQPGTTTTQIPKLLHRPFSNVVGTKRSRGVEPDDLMMAGSSGCISLHVGWIMLAERRCVLAMPRPLRLPRNWQTRCHCFGHASSRFDLTCQTCHTSDATCLQAKLVRMAVSCIEASHPLSYQKQPRANLDPLLGLPGGLSGRPHPHASRSIEASEAGGWGAGQSRFSFRSPVRVVHGIMETICHCVAGIHPVVRDPPRDTGWRTTTLLLIFQLHSPSRLFTTRYW